MFEKKNFTIEQVPDLTGKVAIVTGGNSGIGYVTCRELARKGAHVFLCSRNMEKGQTAVDEIKQETGNQMVEVLQLDLENLKEVKKSAETFLARNLPLHILVNNAGIMAVPFQRTVNGVERQIATNHFGHFLFTTTLLPVIEASAPSRIVNITSKAHSYAPKDGINFEDIDLEHENTFVRYGQSKAANILFTIELSKRLAGKQVYVNSVHPGVVRTNLSRGMIDGYGKWLEPLFGLFKLFFISADDGALAQLYAATSPEIEEKDYRGLYFIPYGKIDTPKSFATNEETAAKLWKHSEELVAEKLAS